MDFFIGDPFKSTKRNKGKLILKTRSIIRTPRAFTRCTPDFTGHFTAFSIRFHPTGLYNLLGISMDQLGNNSIPASEIKIFPIEEMTDRMLYASDISHCIEIIEPYLLCCAMKQRSTQNFIEEAARKIISEKGQVSINELASGSYLSVSQLEKKFIKQIGVSPKTYSCMQRIFQLVIDKTRRPDTKWSALAYEYGYFDSIHFSREFNKYFSFNPSGFAPSNFILM